MKKLSSLALIIILMSIGLLAHWDCDHDCNHSTFNMEERDYDFEDDCLYIYNREDCDEYIKITSEPELFVNGELIEITYSERRILRKYYYGIREIRDRAIDLGCDGAKLGLKGAVVGLKAVANIPLVLFGDVDRFEERIENETDRIEIEAEKLEKRGEEIEKLADKIEEYEDKLKIRIIELDDLDWY